jgi:hypothetical protein
MVIMSSVVTVMAPAPVSVVDIIVAQSVVAEISVVCSEITIVISMVSKIMIPISVVSVESPFTVANWEMISVSIMVSMVSIITPVMVGISMMSIAMVSPWFVMFVSTNYSNM